MVLCYCLKRPIIKMGIYDYMKLWLGTRLMIPYSLRNVHYLVHKSFSWLLSSDLYQITSCSNYFNITITSITIDHEITLKILEFILNSIKEIKPGFLFSSMCMFSESNGKNLIAFTYKIQVFCRPEWTKRGTAWKWILIIFKCKNEFSKQLGLEKQVKKWGHLSGL